MGHYGGKGPMTNVILWVETVIFAIFVGLRIYTRKWVLDAVGADDYMVMLAMVLQILYTVFVTIASTYGLGQLFDAVGSADAYYMAVKYEVFSQVAGIMVIGVGKVSVGLFLLRIVRNKIQVAVIWFFIVGTTIITIFSSIAVVVQCIPVQKTWDPTVKGNCWLDFTKVGLTVGSWFVIDDFAFAILPWFFIWDLNMKRKEKFTVACGLSLGVFAGICGIVRTVALDGLNESEYIYDTVPMLIWSGTESTVTIMCSSIPVLRPLYVRIKYGSKGDSSGNGSYSLPKYGSRKYAQGSAALDDMEPKGVSHQAVVTYNSNNASDESILRATKANDGTNPNGGAIRKTEEYVVTYEQYGKPV